MLEALIIMGLTAAGGAWMVTSDATDPDEGASQDAAVNHAEPMMAQDLGDETEDLLTLIFGDTPVGGEGLCIAGQCLDNFDPEAGPLLIEPPQGFDAEHADVDLVYDPHFHQTDITVTAPDGSSFVTAVSGVTPDALGPENVMLAA